MIFLRGQSANLEGGGAGLDERELYGNELVAKLLAASDPAEKEVLAIQLDTVVKAIAEKLVGPSTQGRFPEFIDEAPGIIWEKLKKWEQFHRDNPKMPFMAWCSCVLENKLYDNFREDKRRGKLAAEAAMVKSLPRRPLPVLPSQLSEAALHEITTWKPKIQVFLLVKGLLWDRVPQNQWDGWLKAAGINPPFPPPSLHPSKAKSADLNRLLMENLNLKRPNLDKIWSRNKSLLESLPDLGAFFEGETADG